MTEKTPEKVVIHFIKMKYDDDEHACSTVCYVLQSLPGISTKSERHCLVLSSRTTFLLRHGHVISPLKLYLVYISGSPIHGEPHCVTR